MGTETHAVTCCLCRDAVDRSGWCGNCQTWPINITPIRYHGDHRVDMDGFCWTCKDYVLTQLEPHPGWWIDTRRVPILLSREENAKRLKGLRAILDGAVPKPQLIAFCEAMARREPGIGWDLAAKTLRDHMGGIASEYRPQRTSRRGYEGVLATERALMGPVQIEARINLGLMAPVEAPVVERDEVPF